MDDEVLSSYKHSKDLNGYMFAQNQSTESQFGIQNCDSWDRFLRGLFLTWAMQVGATPSLSYQLL